MQMQEHVIDNTRLNQLAVVANYDKKCIQIIGSDKGSQLTLMEVPGN